MVDATMIGSCVAMPTGDTALCPNPVSEHPTSSGATRSLKQRRAMEPPLSLCKNMSSLVVSWRVSCGGDGTPCVERRACVWRYACATTYQLVGVLGNHQVVFAVAWIAAVDHVWRRLGVFKDNALAQVKYGSRAQDVPVYSAGWRDDGVCSFVLAVEQVSGIVVVGGVYKAVANATCRELSMQAELGGAGVDGVHTQQLLVIHIERGVCHWRGIVKEDLQGAF